MHGQGSWEPTLVAQSLDGFEECLTVFQRFATARSNEMELAANPATAEEQSRYLEDIRTLTNGRPEALGFWAVQVDIDLDAIVS